MRRAVACRGVSGPCLLAAGAGLLVLLAVAAAGTWPYIPAAVSLASLAIGLQESRRPRLSAAAALLAVTSWGLSIAFSYVGSEALVSAGLLCGFAAAALGAVAGGAGAGLAVFASSYGSLAAYFGWGHAAMSVYSVGYVVLGGLLGGLLSGRLHPLLAIPAAPLLALLPLDVQASVALLVYLALLAGSFMGWTRCPFGVDSGLVFAGVILGLAGGLAMGLPGYAKVEGLGLYSLGILLVLAGVLTPSSAPHTGSS